MLSPKELLLTDDNLDEQFACIQSARGESSQTYEYVMNIQFRRNFKQPALKIRQMISELKENSMCKIVNSQVKEQGSFIRIIFSASQKDC